MKFSLGSVHINIGRDAAPVWADELEGRITRTVREAMARLEDKMAELNTILGDIGTTVTEVAGDVTSLITQVEELKNSDDGDMTEAQLAVVDGVLAKATAIKGRLTELDAMNPATPSTGDDEQIDPPNPDA